MLNLTRPAAALAALLFIAGCSRMQIEDFADTEPRLVLEEYFAGEVRAWGIFEDRSGTVRRQFTVDIVGTWDGETLTLDEGFVFADGETDRRVWRITRLDDTTYEGRADDVIGVAKGRSMGNALKWVYDLDLKVGDGTTRVRFNDWMFLQPDGVLLNRARVSKFGFKVGQVTLTFRRMDQSAAGAGTTPLLATLQAAE